MKIALKLKPFSHRNGEVFLLPGTTVALRCFPTRIEGEDLAGKIAPFWIEYNWTGPVKKFTAELDCQKQELHLFGFAQEGYFSYRLKTQEGALQLYVDKCPSSTLCTSSLFAQKTLKTLTLLSLPTANSSSIERLSLGSHKAQEIVKMHERLDPCELFPLWLKIAELCPQGSYKKGLEGHYALLHTCTQQNKEGVIPSLLSFFQSAFQGCFVPCLVDLAHQGIIKASQEKVSAVPLLIDSAAYIRSLFYQEVAPYHIALLPLLPKELPCGRFVDIRTKEGVILSFEWRKHRLRSVSITSVEPCLIRLTVPKGITSCRVGKKRVVKIENGAFEQPLKAKGLLFIDRFRF